MHTKLVFKYYLLMAVVVCHAPRHNKVARMISIYEYTLVLLFLTPEVVTTEDLIKFWVSVAI